MLPHLLPQLLLPAFASNKLPPLLAHPPAPSVRHAAPSCVLDQLPSFPALQLVAEAVEDAAQGTDLSVGAAWDAVAPAFDALDLVLLSPLLLPVFGLWALQATGSGAGALLEKASAMQAVKKAEREVAALEKQLEQAKAKTVAAEETTKRKVKFWEGKVDKQRKESLDILRSAKEGLRKDIAKAEAKAQLAEQQLAALQQQLSSPPPPQMSPDMTKALSDAEQRAQAAEAALAKLQATVAEGSAGAEPATAEVSSPPSQSSLLVISQPGQVESRVRLQAGIRAGDAVLVTGAAGPTGRLVVEMLLTTYPGVRVRAHASNRTKLEEAVADIKTRVANSNVELLSMDLDLPEEISNAVVGASAVVWCASSFGGDKIERTFFEELQYQMQNGRPVILDSEGVERAAKAFASRTALLPEDASSITPKFVLLSSAAVSRPKWSPEWNRDYAEAAEIPIVQLNPENILDTKFEGEQSVRSSGVPYCVVRPCGLNAEHPNGRFVVSSGDVATGRISRQDVAEFLVSVLAEPGAEGKTMEIFTLPDLPKRSMSDVITSLPKDTADGCPTPNADIYSVLKQLSPGSSNDAVPSGASKPN